MPALRAGQPPAAHESTVPRSSAPCSTRGFAVDDFREIGKVIGAALTGDFSDAKRGELAERTGALAERYPLYPQLSEAAAV